MCNNKPTHAHTHMYIYIIIYYHNYIYIWYMILSRSSISIQISSNIIGHFSSFFYISCRCPSHAIPGLIQGVGHSLCCFHEEVIRDGGGFATPRGPPRSPLETMGKKRWKKWGKHGGNPGKNGENMVETLEKMEKTMEHPGKKWENMVNGENMWKQWKTSDMYGKGMVESPTDVEDVKVLWWNLPA